NGHTTWPFPGNTNVRSTPLPDTRPRDDRLRKLRLPVPLAIKIEKIPPRLPAEMIARFGRQHRTLKRRPIGRQRGVVRMMPRQSLAQRMKTENFRGTEVIRLESRPRVFQRQ